ncbi:ribokinase [Bifidobacterium sp. ESL0763]|uniref:ribokinase n=1 Tax=Bifidobacterium sp. ESL0763 TaxID=2983227 RepID=UPI0023F8C78B|nr:ribokinase [Bifidobacterium sp. ESL0763]MDF7663255.1 ribokinase [Bifidobacterium sp. ESL0763]
MTRIDLSALDHISGSISIVGSMNADYTVTTERLPQPGETLNGGPLQILPGGKSGNQAAVAARIGANVTMFGAVGSDANGDFLLGRLQDAGVDTSHVRHVGGASGTTVITVDAKGENTIIYSAGSNAKVDMDYVNSQKETLLASSVLGLCLESPMETVTATAKMCHDAGIKVLLNDSPFTAELPEELIRYADVLLVNEHEMAQLLGIGEPEDGDWLGSDWGAIAASMHEFGFKEAIVTLGGDGAVVIDADGSTHHVEAATVDAKDTTGCGDAFMGTLLAGLSSGLSIRDSASLAVYVAGYAATNYGAQASYGTGEEIKRFFGAE